MEKENRQNSSEPILSFEAALKRLDEIVHSLEEGDLELDEALGRYEEGVKLLRQSYDLLQRAERRIELLSGIDAQGDPITQPFDDTATFNVGQVRNLSLQEGQVRNLSPQKGQIGNLPHGAPHEESVKHRGRRGSAQELPSEDG